MGDEEFSIIAPISKAGVEVKPNQNVKKKERLERIYLYIYICMRSL